MWWCSLERRPSAEELLSSCLAKIKGTSAAEAALLATCFGTAEAVPLSKTDCFDSVHPTHRKCAMDGAPGLFVCGLGEDGELEGGADGYVVRVGDVVGFGDL